MNDNVGSSKVKTRTIKISHILETATTHATDYSGENGFVPQNKIPTINLPLKHVKTNMNVFLM